VERVEEPSCDSNLTRNYSSPIRHVDRSTVPPDGVGDVLEKTTESDWPLGLIVMATISGVVSDPQKMEANRAELLIILNKLGIRVVWGPPSG
jgi:hypothetical protein